ncbi:hypothetical protein [Streptomyces swartbergensis]|nr:hypothetical protein [Streptomyces swartbergensis]
MFEVIRWRCYAHVTDHRGAERVVGRIGELWPHAIEIESYERYWKFRELAELRFVSPLRLRNEFEGIASSNTGASFRVPGIEWMEFTITAG